jgi:transposase InsO family protein
VSVNTSSHPCAAQHRRRWASGPAELERRVLGSAIRGRTARSCGVLASMGSVADCYDNAMAESIFATLETELVYTRAWPSRHELEVEAFSHIEGFYNPRR